MICGGEYAGRVEGLEGAWLVGGMVGWDEEGLLRGCSDGGIGMLQRLALIHI